VDKLLTSKETKLTLLLLCWLFGLLSIHRFYTGKYISGGLQLLSSVLTTVFVISEIKTPAVITGFILVLWLTIDILWIIMGKFTDKEGKPITDWM
jgi:TM2 domain-containing membrane protein YozV